MLKNFLITMLLLCSTLTYGQNSWFDLEVQFDGFGPSESFTLITQAGDTLVNHTPAAGYELYQTTVLCDSGDVEISLFDSFGDGWGPTPSGQPIANITMSNSCQGIILDLDADFAFTQFDTTVNLLACPPPIYGCMDSTALNYDSSATSDDGSCSYPYQLPGCMDPLSSNFNPWAQIDDGSCMAGPSSCPQGQSSVEIVLTPDQWPQETSWTLYDTAGIVIASAPQGTYTGSTPGVPISTYICVDELQDYYLEINDSYGDGLGGSTSGGTIDGNVQVFDCIDNELFNLADSIPNSNFGNTFTSPQFLIPTCAYVSPPQGCMDPMYVEYDPLACIDDSSCATLRVQGCTDPTSFNYDPNANTNEVIEGFYNLQILDGASDGWGGTWLGLRQGHWVSPQYQMGPNDGNSISFPVQLNAYQPVYAYVFTTQQSILSISQIAFNLTGPDGDTIIDVIYWDAIPFPFVLESDSVPTFGETCIPIITGCLDSTSFNYILPTGDPLVDVNTDDGSCIPVVVGCMNPLAFNYDSTANVDDPSSCIPVVVGCMDSTSFNYDPNANTPGTCIPIVEGCTDPTSFNYDANANTDDGSCIAVLLGCTDPTSFNYDPSANTDDGSCIPIVYGCTDPSQFNYDPNANTDDGSCIPIVYGCTDPSQFNYDPLANTDNGSCIPIIYGCMDSTQFNYDPLANTDNGSCIPIIYGCTDNTAINYDPLANTDDGSCIPILAGCTDSNSYNYNPLANTDDGSCISFIYGCTDPSALNYNPAANTEDFSCIPIIYGCMDSTSVNFNPLANVDNGTCITAISGCMDPDSYTFNPLANVSDSTACFYDAGCITGPGNPYWLNNQCYAWVIDVDNYCCDNEWDPTCQELYNYCEDGWPNGVDIWENGRIADFNGIIVYPNPAKEVLNIATDLEITVALYDMTGKLLRSKVTNKQIDLKNLPSGLYFLQINYNGNIYNKKIIKE
jgi:hypothetical protein